MRQTDSHRERQTLRQSERQGGTERDNERGQNSRGPERFSWFVPHEVTFYKLFVEQIPPTRNK